MSPPSLSPKLSLSWCENLKSNLFFFLPCLRASVALLKGRVCVRLQAPWKVLYLVLDPDSIPLNQNNKNVVYYISLWKYVTYKFLLWWHMWENTYYVLLHGKWLRNPPLHWKLFSLSWALRQKGQSDRGSARLCFLRSVPQVWMGRASLHTHGAIHYSVNRGLSCTVKSFLTHRTNTNMYKSVSQTQTGYYEHWRCTGSRCKLDHLYV